MRAHSARVEFSLDQQFLRYFVLFGCHCVCGQAGSCLRGNGCTEAQHPFLTRASMFAPLHRRHPFHRRATPASNSRIRNANYPLTFRTGV